MANAQSYDDASNCDSVVLPQVANDIKGKEQEFCPRCECKYESRNTTIIQEETNSNIAVGSSHAMGVRSNVLNRVGHQQDKWKKQVREQRRNIYDQRIVTGMATDDGFDEAVRGTDTLGDVMASLTGGATTKWSGDHQRKVFEICKVHWLTNKTSAGRCVNLYAERYTIDFQLSTAMSWYMITVDHKPYRVKEIVRLEKNAFQLHAAASNVSFILCLTLIAKYSALIEPIVNVLQSTAMDVVKISQHIKRIVQLLKSHRDNPEIISDATEIAKKLGLEEDMTSMPRIVERQLHRSNHSTGTPSEFWKRSLVLSGDSVIIRGVPKGGPPPEKQINLSNITAPKLARRAIGNSEETKDEPYAWEAREFLRKKIIGEDVLFTVEKPPNTTREYGVIYIGKDIATAENLTETLISEGLVSVRREGVRAGPELQRLIELEDAAKSAGKGKWATSGAQEHIRDIKWSVDNPRNFVDKCGGKPIAAVIEHVRDGSTIRAFLTPDFYHITLMISGIRCPGFKLNAEGKPDPNAVVPYSEEAKFFVESRLLQRDVEIVLESVNNNNFVGSIIHPKGNIAEALLQEGFAHCVDWSIAFMKTGADKLRAAEKIAKEAKKRIWENYQPNTTQISGKEKEFSGTVFEVVNGDALVVKLADGSLKKVFLASIRPPRRETWRAFAAASQGFTPLV
uniref:TNase-like domain-containing protein n=1 Tax=Timema genevievae TaxID=629358 RepID=A0A7R9PMG5_TIMGE|nr:unnamed protein product [Timema genevievae]